MRGERIMGKVLAKSESGEWSMNYGRDGVKPGITGPVFN